MYEYVVRTFIIKELSTYVIETNKFKLNLKSDYTLICNVII